MMKACGLWKVMITFVERNRNKTTSTCDDQCGFADAELHVVEEREITNKGRYIFEYIVFILNRFYHGEALKYIPGD